MIDEGYYQGGKFQFETEVPDAYNMVVSSPRLSRCSPFAWRVAVTGPGSPPALCPSAAHPVLGLSTKWLIFVWLMPLISSIESFSGEVPFLNKCLRVPCASVCWGAALPRLELPPRGWYLYRGRLGHFMHILLDSGTGEKSILFKTVVLFMV